MPGPRLNTFSALLQKFEGGVVPGYQVKIISIPLSIAGEWVYLDRPIECDATDLIWLPYTYGRSEGIFEYALNDADRTQDWIQCRYQAVQTLEKVDIKNFPIYRIHVRHNIVTKVSDENDLQIQLAIFNDPRLTWQLNRGTP